MSSAPKWTPLERHDAKCGAEFCMLHKAAPRMAEALQHMIAAWDNETARSVSMRAEAIRAIRAALREAGIEP